MGHVNKKYSTGGTCGVYGLSNNERGGSSGPKAFTVSGSEDGEIVIWDVISKEILQRLTGHEGVVLGVDTLGGGGGGGGGGDEVGMSEKGSLVVSGGLDRTVRIWSINKEEGEVEAEAEAEACAKEEEVEVEMEMGREKRQVNDVVSDEVDAEVEDEDVDMIGP